MKPADITEQVLQRLLDWLEASAQFAAVQAPILAQETIAWGIWSHCIIAAVFLVFAIGFYKFRSCVLTWPSGSDGRDFGMFFAWVGIGGSFAFVANNLYWSAFAVIAPRLYLLTALRDAVSGGGCP